MSNFDPSIPAAAPGTVHSDAVLNYNGTDFDLQRGNISQVLMASSSISASTAISVTNWNARGMYAFMNITSAFPGSGSTTLALKVQLIPPNATASAVTIASTLAQSASGMTTLCIYPGIANAASASAGGVVVRTSTFPLPRNFRVLASYSSAAASAALTVSIGIMSIL